MEKFCTESERCDNFLVTNKFLECYDNERNKIIPDHILNDKIELLRKNFYKRKYKITYNQN